MKTILSLALISASLAFPAKAVIIGNSVGYLLDHEQAYLTARIGGQFYSGELFTHIGELEVGGAFDSGSGIDTNFVPVTINYRVQFGEVAGLLSGYFGIGGGMARYRISGNGVDVEDWTRVGQAFAGVSFLLFKSVRIDLGARYIRLLEDDFFWGSRAEDRDDIAIEAGLNFRF